MATEKVFKPTEEQLEKIYQMASNGMTQIQIAGYFRLRVTTFVKMKKRHPEIIKAMEDGRFSGIDHITGKLRMLIDANNVQAIIFACKTVALMRERDRIGDPNYPLPDAYKPKKIDLKGMSSVEASKIYQQIMSGEQKL